MFMSERAASLERKSDNSVKHSPREDSMWDSASGDGTRFSESLPGRCRSIRDPEGRLIQPAHKIDSGRRFGDVAHGYAPTFAVPSDFGEADDGQMLMLGDTVIVDQSFRTDCPRDPLDTDTNTRSVDLQKGEEGTIIAKKADGWLKIRKSEDSAILWQSSARPRNDSELWITPRLTHNLIKHHARLANTPRPPTSIPPSFTPPDTPQAPPSHEALGDLAPCRGGGGAGCTHTPPCRERPRVSFEEAMSFDLATSTSADPDERPSMSLEQAIRLEQAIARSDLENNTRRTLI